MKTVYLIDDHPVVALGLRIALAGVETLRLVGLATEPEDGLAAIESARPQCLVLDLVFAGSVAFSVIGRARLLLPRSVIVVFSSLPARLYARDAQEAGADAYLGKDADMAELVRLLNGQDFERAPPPSKWRATTMVDPLTVDGVHMTPRELQIASSIGRGLSVEAIAARNSTSAHERSRPTERTSAGSFNAATARSSSPVGTAERRRCG